MEETKTFDDAYNAANEMFTDNADGSEQQIESAVNSDNENVVEQQTNTDNAEETNEMNTLDRAVTAAEKSVELLNRERQENETLRQRIAQMEQASRQQSEQAVQAQEQRATADEIPILDVSGMAFDDDETIKRKQGEYAKAMMEYSQKHIMDELAPYIEAAREGLLEKERAQTLQQLGNIPQLAGLGESINDVEHIIANNPIFSSQSDMSLSDKYINAYMMLKGMNAVNTPPSGPTAEDFMKMYNENPQLQDMVERERIAKLNTGTPQNIPPLSSAGGAANIALNIKEKPKTFEDASKMAFSFFNNKN